MVRSGVRAPTCVACELPVLELLGQSAVLPAYLIQAGSPPPETAGTWHLSCLRSSGLGEQWALASERNYLEVRHYVLQARTPDWSVLSNPNSGEVFALCRQGGTLPLHGHGTVFQTPTGGLAYHIHDEQYWLEWDRPVIATVQEQLRQSGSVPVQGVARLLGMEHRLTDPDVLTAAAFRLDADLASQWQPTFVGAAVDYAAHLPRELATHYQPSV